MKRYDIHIETGFYSSGEIRSAGMRLSTINGDYVLFTDAEADKHAALKELAAEVLPYIRPASFLREIKGISTFEENEALYAKLKSITEGPV